MNVTWPGQICVCCALLAASTHASAAIFTSGAVGTAAPPATLGPYTMVPFANDTQPKVTMVAGVPSPLVGSVTFAPQLQHFDIPFGWGTWSHGYGGDVYWTVRAHQVTLTLPPGTKAFYFYAQPNPFGAHEIVATAQDGSMLAQSPDGNGGARYYGFYATESDTIQTIQVTSPDPGAVDFAIGEFGIANGLPADQADLNGDGNVDGTDLGMLLGAWTGASVFIPCPPHPLADLNHDCRINGLDLAMLLGAWTG